MLSATVELVYCEGLAVKCLKINKIPKSVKPRSFRALDSSVMHFHAVNLFVFILIGSVCLFVHRCVSVNLSVGLNGNMSTGDILAGSALCTAVCCGPVGLWACNRARSFYHFSKYVTHWKLWEFRYQRPLTVKCLDPEDDATDILRNGTSSPVRVFSPKFSVLKPLAEISEVQCAVVVWNLGLADAAFCTAGVNWCAVE